MDDPPPLGYGEADRKKLSPGSSSYYPRTVELMCQEFKFGTTWKSFPTRFGFFVPLSTNIAHPGPRTLLAGIEMWDAKVVLYRG